MNKRGKAVFLIYMGLFVLTSAALLVWINPYGAGVNPDSIVYISAAKSLLSGEGYSVNGSLITHYPPLYSLFLSAAGLFVDDLIQAARFINAILFGVNTGLVATAVYIAAGRSYLTTILAAFFYLASSAILVVHSWAWSEPLFITFTLTSIIILVLYVTRPFNSLFIFSAISMGLALNTRFIGLAYLPAALALVFLGRRGQRIGRRLRYVLIWFLLVCAPLGLFLLRNITRAGSAANRSYGFHPLAVLRFITDFISHTSDFFAPLALPSGVRPTLFGLLAVILLALLIILLKRPRKDIDWESISFVMASACLAITFCYLLFLYVSIATFDAATPVIPRILAPIFTILIVGVFSGIWVMSQSLKKPAILWGFQLLIGLLIIIKTVDSAKTAAIIHKDGLGYTSRVWRESESLSFVKSLAPEVKIYSNGPDVLHFLIEKEAVLIPPKTNANTLIANPDFDNGIQAMCRDIIKNGALFVYLDNVKRWYLPTGGDIESICSLPVLCDFSDGTVYGGN